ncbi:UNVERIFIED_CONTAM: hypothetical protein RMT77_019791 [Armadillidium vulgare]
MNYLLGGFASSSQQEKDCLSVAIPASGVGKDELFWDGSFTLLRNDECHVFSMTINGDEYIDSTRHGKVNCTEEYAFFCFGF